MNNQHIVLEKRQTAAASIGLSSVWKVIKCALTFCLAFILLIGCGGEPELENPEIREKILEKAIEIRKLQFRSGTSGENLIYSPNQKQPYTGWVKRILRERNDRFLLQLQRGKPNGLFIMWWEDRSNTSIAMKGTLKHDQKVGVWTFWHASGQKAAEGTYNNEQISKSELYHFDSSSLLYDDFASLYYTEEDAWKQNHRHGKWVFWYENGQKEREGSYKNGERTGLWIEWDQDGEETGRRTYKN